MVINTWQGKQVVNWRIPGLAAGLMSVRGGEFVAFGPPGWKVHFDADSLAPGVTIGDRAKMGYFITRLDAAAYRVDTPAHTTYTFRSGVLVLITTEHGDNYRIAAHGTKIDRISDSSEGTIVAATYDELGRVNEVKTSTTGLEFGWNDDGTLRFVSDSSGGEMARFEYVSGRTKVSQPNAAEVILVWPPLPDSRSARRYIAASANFE